MSFPTWCVLRRKVYQSVADLCSAIEASGAKISDRAKELLQNEGFGLTSPEDDFQLPPQGKEFQLTRQEEDVDLVCVSNSDLGKPEGCTLQVTIYLAAERDLYPCPVDSAPQLREAYRDQPLGESLIVVTEPMSNSVGRLCLFALLCDDNVRWLHGFYGSPTYFRVGGKLFVFRRRKAA